jgi:hypothetical protein
LVTCARNSATSSATVVGNGGRQRGKSGHKEPQELASGNLRRRYKQTRRDRPSSLRRAGGHCQSRNASDLPSAAATSPSRLVPPRTLITVACPINWQRLRNTYAARPLPGSSRFSTSSRACPVAQSLGRHESRLQRLPRRVLCPLADRRFGDGRMVALMDTTCTTLALGNNRAAPPIRPRIRESPPFISCSLGAETPSRRSERSRHVCLLECGRYRRRITRSLIRLLSPISQSPGCCTRGWFV